MARSPRWSAIWCFWVIVVGVLVFVFRPQLAKEAPIEEDLEKMEKKLEENMSTRIFLTLTITSALAAMAILIFEAIYYRERHARWAREEEEDEYEDSEIDPEEAERILRATI